LPYQRRWIQDSSAIAVHRKAPKIGVTYADAMKTLVDACAGFSTEYVAVPCECRRYREMICRLALESQIFIEDCDGILKLNNGAMIAPQKGFSTGIIPHAVVIDHAAFKDNLKEVVGVCLDTGVKQLRLISTCNGANSQFERIHEIVASHIRNYPAEAIQEITAQPIAVHTTTLDEAIAEGWFELLCQITGNDASFLDAQHYRKAMTQMYSPELLFCEPRKGT
jgi:phage FluMu gp28-like protein